MTTVLKLGGSVVTHKDQPDTVDEETLARVARDVSASTPDDLVLVHGGGSFGHHHAARHGVTATDGTHDVTAIADIHAAMAELNRAVVAGLQEEGVNAVPMRPFSMAHRDDGLSLPAESVTAMLREGFVPVLHGDVVVDSGKGATILSGDDIVVALADSLSADRVGVCSTVPGVLDADDEVISAIDAYADVAEHLGGSEATDVTGGMAGKVRALLALDAPAHVFDPEGLAAFLEGGAPGTVVGSHP